MGDTNQAVRWGGRRKPMALTRDSILGELTDGIGEMLPCFTSCHQGEPETPSEEGPDNVKEA